MLYPYYRMLIIENTSSLCFAVVSDPKNDHTNQNCKAMLIIKGENYDCSDF